VEIRFTGKQYLLIELLKNAKIIIGLLEVLSTKIQAHKSSNFSTKSQKINSTTVEFAAQKPIPTKHRDKC